MPNLTSFISANQYNSETVQSPALLCGLLTGSTYNTGFTYSASGASNDPGGMFGWLVWSRVNSTPAKGTTADTYILYSTPQDFVNDFNNLGNVTNSLVSGSTAQGTTFAFFGLGSINSSNLQVITPKTNGNDFLMAINYLAYGGRLLVAPTTTGFDNYLTATDDYIDVVIAKEAGASLAQWLEGQPYTVGIFPTIASSGITGNGYTMAAFDSLFSSSSFVSGTTVADRIFNIYGTKTVTGIDTSSAYSSSTLTYTLPTTPDIAGFFARAKSNNQIYLSVAGLSISQILNGSVTNAIDWDSTLKTALRNNRVNFFVNNTPKFLGLDLTGATANANSTSSDRIGPINLKIATKKLLYDTGLKYLYQINNAATRATITSEIQSNINRWAAYVDTAATQIICNNSNNTNGSTTLNMQVTIKPLVSTTSFTTSVSLAQA